MFENLGEGFSMFIFKNFCVRKFLVCLIFFIFYFEAFFEAFLKIFLEGTTFVTPPRVLFIDQVDSVRGGLNYL
jgi:hypothetical protein